MHWWIVYNKDQEACSTFDVVEALTHCYFLFKDWVLWVRKENSRGEMAAQKAFFSPSQIDSIFLSQQHLLNFNYKRSSEVNCNNTQHIMLK